MMAETIVDMLCEAAELMWARNSALASRLLELANRVYVEEVMD